MTITPWSKLSRETVLQSFNLGHNYILRCNYGKAKHSNGLTSVDKFPPSIAVLKDLYDPYLQCEDANP